MSEAATPPLHVEPPLQVEPPLRVEPLADRHERAAFESGVEALDTFLRRFAGQNDRRGLGRTFVAVRGESPRVAGCYTLSAGAVRTEVLPPDAARRLPLYPVPVALLGRLAVDRTEQGRGLGAVLLVDALWRVVGAAEALGVHAVEVVAKDARARTFYLHHGFVALADDPLHLYLPLDTIRRLRT